MATLIAKPQGAASTVHNRNVLHDTEPDDLWKQSLRSRIEEGFKSMVDDARKNLEAKLKLAPVSSEEREILTKEHLEAMRNIRKLASEQFQIELERERQERRWAAGQQMNPMWAGVLMHEQQAILDRAKMDGGQVGNSQSVSMENQSDGHVHAINDVPASLVQTPLTPSKVGPEDNYYQPASHKDKVNINDHRDFSRRRNGSTSSDWNFSLGQPLTEEPLEFDSLLRSPPPPPPLLTKSRAGSLSERPTEIFRAPGSYHTSDRPTPSSRPKIPEFWTPSMSLEEDATNSRPYVIGRRGSAASMRSVNSVPYRPPSANPIIERSGDIDHVANHSERDGIRQEAERTRVLPEGTEQERLYQENEWETAKIAVAGIERETLRQEAEKAERERILLQEAERAWNDVTKARQREKVGSLRMNSRQSASSEPTQRLEDGFVSQPVLAAAGRPTERSSQAPYPLRPVFRETSMTLEYAERRSESYHNTTSDSHRLYPESFEASRHGSPPMEIPQHRTDSRQSTDSDESNIRSYDGQRPQQGPPSAARNDFLFSADPPDRPADNRSSNPVDHPYRRPPDNQYNHPSTTVRPMLGREGSFSKDLPDRMDSYDSSSPPMSSNFTRTLEGHAHFQPTPTSTAPVMVPKAPYAQDDTRRYLAPSPTSWGWSGPSRSPETRFDSAYPRSPHIPDDSTRSSWQPPLRSPLSKHSLRYDYAESYNFSGREIRQDMDNDYNVIMFDRQFDLELQARETNRREEEAKRKENEAKRKEEEVKQKEEEARKKVVEARKKEEEIRRKEEEARKKEEETRQKEEEVKLKEEEAKRKEEEAKRKEKEIKRKEEEARLKEEEARRKEKEVQQKEEETRRKEAEVKRREEEVKRREEELNRREAETRKKEEEKQRVQQEEFRKREEDIRRRAEERKRQDSLGSDNNWPGSAYSSATSSSGPSWSIPHRGGSGGQPSTGADRNSASSSTRNSAGATGPSWSSPARPSPTTSSQPTGAARSPSTPTSAKTAQGSLKTGFPSSGTSPSSPPSATSFSESEWKRRQAEQAQKQQEQFQKEQERLERERQAKAAGRIMTKEEIAQLFEIHERKWSRLMVTEQLDWESFPWPMLKQPSIPEEITAIAISAYVLSPYYPDKSKADKDRIKEHIRRWHPDRFETKLLPKVKEGEREKVQSGAGSVVRSLNDLLSRSNNQSIFS